MMHGSWDMVHDGWTDEMTHIEVGAPPKNKNGRSLLNLSKINLKEIWNHNWE